MYNGKPCLQSCAAVGRREGTIEYGTLIWVQKSSLDMFVVDSSCSLSTCAHCQIIAMELLELRAGAAPQMVAGQLQCRLKDAHARTHYAAAAYKVKSDDSTRLYHIGRLLIRVTTSLSRIQIIAHVISCMDHQKVVGQMPYLPHRLRRPWSYAYSCMHVQAIQSVTIYQPCKN